MGTLGLHPTRSNSLLVLMDAHDVPLFNNAVVNSVSAARASYGLRAEVVTLEPQMQMAWREAISGRASGRVGRLEPLFDALRRHATVFDAIAITSVIDVPSNAHDDYFRLEGEMINPWGGVEALLTHAIFVNLRKTVCSRSNVRINRTCKLRPRCRRPLAWLPKLSRSLFFSASSKACIAAQALFMTKIYFVVKASSLLKTYLAS